MEPVRVGRAVRALRHRRGWRQVDIAKTCHVSQSAVSRFENGIFDTLSWSAIRRIANAAGMDLQITARWRGGELDRLLDADHAALQSAFAELLNRCSWQVRVEVTFSRYGERGSIDVLAFREAAGILLVVEIKSMVADLQGLLRPLDAKLRLAPGIARERGWNPRVAIPCLVFADGTTTRRRIATHAPLFSRFDLRGRMVRAWLRAPNPVLTPSRLRVAARETRTGQPSGLLVFLKSPPMRGGTARRAGRQRVRLRATHPSVDYRPTSLEPSRRGS